MRHWLATFLLLLILPGWAEPRVVFLGERHTDAADHEAQLVALEELRQSAPVVVVAEMFTERAEAELSSWNSGAGAPAFVSELWQREWGHPQELYLPIWRWARSSGAPVFWLRPDPQYTAAIRERGPAAAVERIGEVLIGPASYREFMAGMASSHTPDPASVDPATVDRYFVIQCFWDEFMAWRISELARQNPDVTLAVLIGDGHLREGEGIPWRLRRRAPNLAQEVRRAGQP